jgi:hypothetical protein
MLDTPGEDTGLGVRADFLLREDKGLTIGSLLDGVHETFFVLMAERDRCRLGTRRHGLELSSERRSGPPVGTVRAGPPSLKPAQRCLLAGMASLAGRCSARVCLVLLSFRLPQWDTLTPTRDSPPLTQKS